jgi:hypothetical protein
MLSYKYTACIVYLLSFVGASPVTGHTHLLTHSIAGNIMYFIPAVSQSLVNATLRPRYLQQRVPDTHCIGA